MQRKINPILPDIATIKKLVANGQIVYKQHSNKRLSERSVTVSEVEQVLTQGVFRPDNPLAKPPTFIASLQLQGRLLEVVLCFDELEPYLAVITVIVKQ